MNQPKGVCPQCGRPTLRGRANPWRPFCSERCRLIDLGEWLGETRRIPADESAHEPPDDAGNSTRH